MPDIALSNSNMIEQLAKAISNYIQPKMPIEFELMDKKRLASYLIVAPSTLNAYIAEPDFPRPIPLNKNGLGHRPPLRWKTIEVIKWVESRQEKPVHTHCVNVENRQEKPAHIIHRISK